MQAVGDADTAVRIAAMDGSGRGGQSGRAGPSTALADDKTACNVCLALGEIGGDAAPAVPALAALLKRDTAAKSAARPS